MKLFRVLAFIHNMKGRLYINLLFLFQLYQVMSCYDVHIYLHVILFSTGVHRSRWLPM